MAQGIAGCEVSESEIRGLLVRLGLHMKEYDACFSRSELRDHAKTMVRGLVSDLPRKSVEPIAELHGVPRLALQQFVGKGKWNDDGMVALTREQVSEKWGDPSALLVIDPSCFAKKGDESVGVKRQWCGRLGKTENCQKGVFVAYVSERGATLVDRALYLPEEWADDPARRTKCRVPDDVKHQTAWQIGLRLIEQCRNMPHGFIVADDEYGRACEFRDGLTAMSEKYVLDVPKNTLVRSPGGEWLQIQAWANARSKGHWTQYHVRDGAKEPITVDVTGGPVQTKRDGRVGPWERALVLRTTGSTPDWNFALSNADTTVPEANLVTAAKGRHSIEELFASGKGDAGMADYEVRSWVGWHNHMALCISALWFLAKERERLGKKISGHHFVAGRLRNARAHSQSSTGQRRTCATNYIETHAK